MDFLNWKNEILQNNRTHFMLNTIINIGRSIPFIILLLILLPVTRFIVGTVLGTTAAIIPLSICAMPFVARLTANALMEIPNGLTEAAQAMGLLNGKLFVNSICQKLYLR